jgi:hypothetical protein
VRDNDLDLDEYEYHDVSQRIARMIIETPDPPCKGCPNAPACGSEKLACVQFEHYIRAVSTEGSWSFWSGATPTHRRYLRAFSPKDLPQSKGRQKIRRPPRRTWLTRKKRAQIIRDLQIHFQSDLTDAQLAATYRLRLPVVSRYRLFAGR